MEAGTLNVFRYSSDRRRSHCLHHILRRKSMLISWASISESIRGRREGFVVKEMHVSCRRPEFTCSTQVVLGDTHRWNPSS